MLLSVGDVFVQFLAYRAPIDCLGEQDSVHVEHQRLDVALVFEFVVGQLAGLTNQIVVQTVAQIVSV